MFSARPRSPNDAVGDRSGAGRGLLGLDGSTALGTLTSGVGAAVVGAVVGGGREGSLRICRGTTVEATHAETAITT